MYFSKTASFSPDCKYFACYSTDSKLKIWETLNTDYIDFKFDSKVYGECTSLNWVLSQHKDSTLKKAKTTKNCASENYLLAVGTSKGDILVYNVTSKNLYLHLVQRHSDTVNDLCFYGATNSLFSCSSDQSVAICDITSGKQKKKWKVDDSPVFSICVIDGNNLLSSSSSIIWWNISEKHALKKFNGHSAEIFKLLPVNAVSLNSCYFLSAAVNDTKINAWSLNSNENQTPVASFLFDNQPVDMDISGISSKDKPLILSTLTKNGFLHLFEHVLNGNVNQPIKPKASIEIDSKSDASILSSKLSADAESCIVAYGTNESNVTFKHIQIREILKQSEGQDTALNKTVFTTVNKETSKSLKGLPINGIKTPSTSTSSPRATWLKEIDSGATNYCRKLRSSSLLASSVLEPEINIHKKEDPVCKNTKQLNKNRSMKDINSKCPENAAEILVKGLKTQNEDIVDAILCNTNPEYINTCVKSIPVSNLKDLLVKIIYRLQHHQQTSLTKWLKEIWRVHLYYLQSQDTAEIVRQSKLCYDAFRVPETLSKLYQLKGILSLRIQDPSSEESDSENEEPMQL